MHNRNFSSSFYFHVHVYVRVHIQAHIHVHIHVHVQKSFIQVNLLFRTLFLVRIRNLGVCSKFSRRRNRIE